MSKKAKPYVVCNDCGVQMFVRNSEGIRRFQEHVKTGVTAGVLTRFKELEQRYRATCPKCDRDFWIDPEQVKTSWFDGEFVGFRCPVKGCDGVAKVGGTQQ